MRLFINERLVRRNSTLGKIFTWGGLGIVIVSVVISFQSPQELNPYVFGGFLGVLLTQIGAVLTNRWGRQPRLDEVLSAALKGLDGRYALFHYLLRVDHALFTPHGAYVLIPRTEDGVIEFEDGRWYQQRERAGFLRRGGRRAIGGFQQKAESSTSKLLRRLRKILPENAVPEVKPVLVFVHTDAQVKVQEAPQFAVHYKKMKAWLRNAPKDQGLDSDQIDHLASSLGV
jgi:hypothetical protein